MLNNAIKRLCKSPYLFAICSFFTIAGLMRVMWGVATCLHAAVIDHAYNCCTADTWLFWAIAGVAVVCSMSLWYRGYIRWGTLIALFAGSYAEIVMNQAGEVVYSPVSVGILVSLWLLTPNSVVQKFGIALSCVIALPMFIGNQAMDSSLYWITASFIGLIALFEILRGATIRHYLCFATIIIPVAHLALHLYPAYGESTLPYTWLIHVWIMLGIIAITVFQPKQGVIVEHTKPQTNGIGPSGPSLLGLRIRNPAGDQVYTRSGELH